MNLEINIASKKRTAALYLVTILLLTFYTQTGMSQSYPDDILPGSSKRVTAGEDTLWILKNSQYKTAIKKSKRLKVVEEENALLTEKTGKLEEIIKISKDEIADLDSSYTRYRDLWTASDKKLEEAELKIIGVKKQRWLFFGGGAVIGITVMVLVR